MYAECQSLVKPPLFTFTHLTVITYIVISVEDRPNGQPLNLAIVIQGSDCRYIWPQMQYNMMSTFIVLQGHRWYCLQVQIVVINVDCKVKCQTDIGASYYAMPRCFPYIKHPLHLFGAVDWAFWIPVLGYVTQMYNAPSEHTADYYKPSPLPQLPSDSSALSKYTLIGDLGPPQSTSSWDEEIRVTIWSSMHWVKCKQTQV